MPANWPDELDVPFGAEPTPEQYVLRTKHILSVLKDKLKKDGVIWWNLRDAYFTRTIVRTSASERLAALEGRHKESWKETPYKRVSYGHPYLKDKDLTLIPFLVAYEAQKLGFWVRSIITWEKETFVPESQVDRPVMSHEYILLFSKSKTYKWNSSEAKELPSNGDLTNMRQLRSVWKITPANGKNGHPAPFPEKLVERCLLITTDKGDIVLDPFLGSGTTALVAEKLGRQFIGVDLVKEYIDQAYDSLRKRFPRRKPKLVEIRSK